MAGRIFWIGMVVVALVASIAMQGRWLFGAAQDAVVEHSTQRAIEARVEQAIESGFEGMQVVGSDGRPIDVAPETRRALGDAVRRLVAAETELAMIESRDAGDEAAQEARRRRDAARADVERLKAEIERQESLSESDPDRMRQQIQQEVRTTVRETIRSAVRN